MKKTILLLLCTIFTILIISFSTLFTGCEYLNRNKYYGKVFNISIQMKENDKFLTKIWKNAKKVSYDKPKNTYTFYVNGKLVEIYSYFGVILSEVGVPNPINSENVINDGKKYTLIVACGKEIIKTWENVTLLSYTYNRISFSYGQTTKTIIPSINETVYIEEVK